MDFTRLFTGNVPVRIKPPPTIVVLYHLVQCSGTKFAGSFVQQGQAELGIFIKGFGNDGYTSTVPYDFV
jgi:hypothetical protein